MTKIQNPENQDFLSCGSAAAMAQVEEEASAAAAAAAAQTQDFRWEKKKKISPRANEKSSKKNSKMVYLGLKRIVTISDCQNVKSQ
jgi:hypothetical protein